MPNPEEEAAWIAAFLARRWGVTIGLLPVPDTPVTLPAAPKLHPPKVGARVGLANGQIDKLVIVGRPTGKHHGQQGQHTTAYAVTRETILNALPVNLPEARARVRLSKLFANLANYPGVKDNADMPADYQAALTRMSNPDLWRDQSIGQAMALYAEMRDAVPGASLPGINHSDTTGSGEGTRLKALREAEQALREADQTLRDDPTEVKDAIARQQRVDTLGKMVDQAAIERLSQADRAKQLDIFLRSAAQAFPNLFVSGYSKDQSVGAKLAASYASALTDREGAVPAPFNNLPDYIRECEAIANDLKPPEGTELAISDTFGAALEPADENGRRKLSIQGRPESIKDGGSQGNHMTSYRTTSNAICSALMEDGRVPTRTQLRDSVTTLLDQFKPAAYLDLFPDLPSELGDGEDCIDAIFDAYWGDDEESDESEIAAFNELKEGDHAAYILRLAEMENKWRLLNEALGGIKDGDAQMEEDALLDIAEMAIALVDERPTSVLYTGVAGGHAEGFYGQQLDALEAREGGANPERALYLLCQQIDLKAIAEMAEKFSDPLVGDGTAVNCDTFRRMVVDEFCTFVRHSHPQVVAMAEGQGGQTLEQLIADVIPQGTIADPTGKKKRKRAGDDDDAYAQEDAVTGNRAPTDRPARKSARKR